MATAESISIRNETALAALTASAASLSARFRIEPPTIPEDYQDRNELPTMQLEAMAEWAGRLLIKVNQPVARPTVEKKELTHVS